MSMRERYQAEQRRRELAARREYKAARTEAQALLKHVAALMEKEVARPHFGHVGDAQAIRERLTEIAVFLTGSDFESEEAGRNAVRAAAGLR